MKERIHFKCSVCGKFIGYDEFSNKQVTTDYIPEDEFQEEKIFYTHEKCKKKLS